jgi:Fe2+ transport system protein FeoA
MPDESKSGAARLIRRLFRRNAATPSALAGSLAELPSGSTVVVERLKGDPELLARLTAQGIAPGVSVHVLQRLPTFVIEVGETTLGLETDVAAAIVIRPE